MSETVITYDRLMGRWKPDAQGRLARAALALFAEQGFEATTVAEIAAAAGVTERTFFRYFDDKREVIFYGAEGAREMVAAAIGEPSAPASPLNAAATAFARWCAKIQREPELARLRDAVVASQGELRERNLLKHAELSETVYQALRARGVDEHAAALAAEVSLAAFRVAFSQWIAEPGGPDLVDVFWATLGGIRDAITT